MAKEVGAAAYYETSVLDNFGINQVFINVTRAALVSRREKHFWNMLGNLKRISKPICQVIYFCDTTTILALHVNITKCI